MRPNTELAAHERTTMFEGIRRRRGIKCLTALSLLGVGSVAIVGMVSGRVIFVCILRLLCTMHINICCSIQCVLFVRECLRVNCRHDINT